MPNAIDRTPKRRLEDQVKKYEALLKKAKSDLLLKEQNERDREDWLRRARTMIAAFYPTPINDIEKVLLSGLSVASINKAAAEHEANGFSDPVDGAPNTDNEHESGEE